MIGQTLSHYRVLDAVGAGGMGVVYRAMDERLDRTVALKMLSEPLVLDRTAVDRLIREARAVSALNHPNIVTVHEIVETESSCFIVMEFVQGRTLRTIAAEPPSSELVVKLGGQIATALAVAHAAGIIHRASGWLCESARFRPGSAYSNQEYTADRRHNKRFWSTGRHCTLHVSRTSAWRNSQRRQRRVLPGACLI